MQDSRTEEIIRRKINEAEQAEAASIDSDALWQRLNAQRINPANKIPWRRYTTLAAALLLVVIGSLALLYRPPVAAPAGDMVLKAEDTAPTVAQQQGGPKQPATESVYSSEEDKAPKRQIAEYSHPKKHKIPIRKATHGRPDFKDPMLYGIDCNPEPTTPGYNTTIESSLLCY